MNEPPVIHKIVFDDETHFLDHHIGTRRCRQSNSTGRKAIQLHWQYLRDYKHTWDQRLLHRMFGCWLGRHDLAEWYRPKTGARGQSCEWCAYHVAEKK